MKPRHVRIAVLIGAGLLALLGAVSVMTASAALMRPQTMISKADAIAVARSALPDNGSGYDVLKTELEPSSAHFTFTDADGMGSLGEDGVTECVVVPPFPIRLGCRPYPVWVIQLSGPSCEATIAINAFSGRFGGAGTAGCEVVPFAGPEPVMFVAEWD